VTSTRYFVAAAASAVLAVIAGLVAAGSGDVSSRLDQNFVASSATTYQCAGTPKETADKIEEEVGRAQARATDPADGTEYLRYRRNLISVAEDATGSCSIRVEDLGRVNNGAFIFLGTGFGPGSPSSSSGGSSGSGSGVK
jgi:putative transposase